ncbi:MAG TPA: hypothetical protein VF549_19410 [Solirubrobacteraceae bacterium]|jgi:hypothetical protein
MRLRSILPAAGVALLLAAPAAVPAAGVKAGSYTGGALRDQPALAYLLVKPGASAVDALVTSRAPCEGYPLPVQATVTFKDVPLDEDGTATATKQIDDTAVGPEGQSARESGEAALTLDVAEDGTAVGTMRLHSVFTDAQSGEQVAECDTGPVPVEMMGVPASAGEGRARRPRRGGLYLGVVNAYPLVAQVRRSGTIDSMAFLYNSRCQQQKRIVFVPTITPGRKGAFRVRGTQQLFSGDGSKEDVTFQMTGRYGRDGGLRGTLRVRGELDSTGAQCDSGELKWRAARAG